MIGDIFFVELAIVLALATILAVIFQKLKQPVILAYIITGIILGSSFLNIITYQEMLGVFSELGIAFLLFIVGINLNPKILKEVGRISVITGIGQITFTCIIGFAIATFLGFNIIESLYLAIALTFSSTIIIVKLLSDKGEINSLYGKISIGFLLVQDFVAVIALMLITSISMQTNIETQIFQFILNIAFFGIVFIIFSKVFSKKIFSILSKNQEILFIGAIAWCLCFTSIAILLGLSKEIGAFIAGVMIASIPFNREVMIKMKYLRDFFIVLFFVILGSNLVFISAEITIIPAIIFSLFVLIGNPIIVFILMILLGYKGRTSFLSSLTVAQISEFSLILIFLGQKVGHLSETIVPIITFVAIITISTSTYMILYNNKIYNILLKKIPLLKSKRLSEKSLHIKKGKHYEVICIGYNDGGKKILSDRRIEKTLVIDFDPKAINDAKKDNFECIYGDISDPEIINEIISAEPKIIISTILDVPTNEVLSKVLKKKTKARIIALANDKKAARRMYKSGIDYVLIPQIIISEKAGTIMKDILAGKKFELHWIDEKLKEETD